MLYFSPTINITLLYTDNVFFLWGMVSTKNANVRGRDVHIL